MGSGESKAAPPSVFSVAVPGTETATSTAARRHPQYAESLITQPVEGITTCYESFQAGVSKSAERPCLGFRPVVDGKPQAFEWETYATVNGRARTFGSGLRNLGLIPVIGDSGMRMVAFYMKNRKEWIIAEQGCYSQAVTTVPMYDTLGAETLTYILNQTELTTLICTAPEISKCVAAKRDCPHLANVILAGGGLTDAIRADCDRVGLRLFAFEDVEANGRETEAPLNLPRAEDCATFCYTSGTTGDPKGAMLSHRNIVSDFSAALANGLHFENVDVHLSYLPLAHVMERVVQACIFYVGACIGFYQGDTLKLLEDLAVLRPTFFVSVPRLLTRIYDKIMLGAQAGGVKTKLFNSGLSSKMQGMTHGYLRHSVWDTVVFKKVARRVGLDRCKFMVTGSAPIPPHVLDFLRVVFQIPVVEGYGQTEGAAAQTVQDLRDYTSGHVGGPIPCNEIKLVAVEDMGYLSTDTVHGADAAAGNPGVPCLGRGEICFRGPNRFMGYYKMPDKTAEAIDADGWVHSGDVGIWLPDGKLKIVDRKKNIFKLSQGEYVAAEKIENAYMKSPMIAQAFVYGDSFQAVLVGVMVPDEDYLRKNWPGWTNLAAMASNAELKKALMADMERLGKECKLLGFEKVKDIFIPSEPFSMENGLLTPTFKLKRNDAKRAFQAQLDAMYELQGGVAGKHVKVA